MSLVSNGVNQVCWLRKITTRLRGTNFCINCTSSVCFATSFMQLWNDPKCTQILQNAPKHLFWVQWGGLGPCEKTRRDFVARTFALIAPVHPFFTEFHAVMKRFQMHPNTMKHNKTWVYGPMWWIRCVRCKKITNWLCGTNFCINWTRSICLAPSFRQLRNDPKCTQILRYGPKH